MGTKPNEREQTDRSLNIERRKADRELEQRTDATEKKSDAVVEVARSRADEVLKDARTRADSKSNGLTGAMQVERNAEDRALAEERQTETDQLQAERDARSKALAELLRLERELTDKDLLSERSGADAALVTRDDFLGMVSHDLRTLLGGVALNAQLLQREHAADSKEARRAESILRCTAGMKRLLTDLLDVVSIEGGRFRVEAISGDVADVIHQVVHAFEQSATTNGISLTAIGVERPLRARFDAERILQVLANLVSNAIKFTRRDGKIELRAREEGELLHVSVSDTGPGIPADQLELIFAPFQQVNRRDRRGLGLGLYISRTIVEALHGRIWAESELGNGTTFHFTLPR